MAQQNGHSRMNLKLHVQLEESDFRRLIALAYLNTERAAFWLMGIEQDWQRTHAGHLPAPIAFPEGLTKSAYPVIRLNNIETPTATPASTTRQNAAGKAPVSPSDSNLTH